MAGVFLKIMNFPTPTIPSSRFLRVFSPAIYQLSPAEFWFGSFGLWLSNA